MSPFDFSVIRNLRRKRGLTAEDLAREAGVTRVTVSKMESNEGNPTVGTLEAVSRVLRIPPSELLRLAEPVRTEMPETEPFEREGLSGSHICFARFEMYLLRAEEGVTTEFEPGLHENTEEICLVLSGRLLLTVGDRTTELGPGSALRFRAFYEHRITAAEASDFLLMHHKID